MRELEVKAGLTTQSDPDGGFLVPERDGKDDRPRAWHGVGDPRARRVINISSDEYKKLVNMGGAGSGWVGEEEARPETDTPTLREIAINRRWSCMPIRHRPRRRSTMRASTSPQWLADEVSIAFAEAEGAAFVAGDGVKKPRGFLQYPTVANASYTWGKLGFIVTGAAAASHRCNPADALIDLYYGLKAGIQERRIVPDLGRGAGHHPQVQGRPGQLPVLGAPRTKPRRRLCSASRSSPTTTCRRLARMRSPWRSATSSAAT
jgi:HK97 family phage major capsid protein